LIKDLDARAQKAGEMAKTATDDAGKQAALDVLGELYYPYHNMVWGWHDAFYPYGKPQWNPDHNLDDMVI